jgi:hypothetical protein
MTNAVFAEGIKGGLDSVNITILKEKVKCMTSYFLPPLPLRTASTTYLSFGVNIEQGS